MKMLMVVFRTSLRERVHDLLHQCDVRAFTEVNETVGYGQTGPAEGLAFYPGTNSVILVALNQDHAERVTRIGEGMVRRGCQASQLGEAGASRILLVHRTDRLADHPSIDLSS